MGEPLLVVNRWKRYGKDRLYVQRPDGTKVGFWDLQTNLGSPESPADLAALAEAVASWRAGQPTSPTFAPSTTANVERQQPTAPPPVDPTPTVTPSPSSDPELAAALRSTEPLSLPTVTSTYTTQPQPPDVPYKRPLAFRVAQALLRIDPDERAGRYEDEGDDKVAAQLDRLSTKDPRWMTAHVSSVGGSASFHVVVGPGGVYLLFARLLTGAEVWVRGDTYMVNGQRQPFITDARATTEHVTELLTRHCGFPVKVSGVNLTIDARTSKIKDLPEGQYAMGRMGISDWLLERRAVLPDEEQLAIFGTVTDPHTWI